MFKKSTVLILHFAPSLRFTLSLQSAFYLRFAVCSPHSAFYTDRRVIPNIAFTRQVG